MIKQVGSRAVLALVIATATACRTAQTAPTPDVDASRARTIETSSALSAQVVQERQIVRTGRMALDGRR